MEWQITTVPASRSNALLEVGGNRFSDYLDQDGSQIRVSWVAMSPAGFA